MYLISFNALALERIAYEKLVDNYVIRLISDNQTKDKLVIQTYKMIHQPDNATALDTIVRQYEKPLWTFIPEQFPVSDKDCLMIDASCMDSNYWRGSCHKNCMVGGPSVLGYDQRTKILYLSEMSSDVGTGGGSFFLIAANLNTKSFKLLKTIGGPNTGSLSPTGEYLIISQLAGIEIYNTKTGESIYIREKNNWTEGRVRLNYISDIKWLDNAKFSFRVGVRHDKFQDSFDEMKESVYDIDYKKIIQSRMMDEAEYKINHI